MEPRIINFGIGCFHFGVIQKPPINLDADSYVNHLKMTLESISNINNVEIDAGDDFKEIKLESETAIEPIDEGMYFFPSLGFDITITFDIYIPFRIQEELNPRGGLKLRTGTERFGVYIFNNYHFPVTFVESIKASDNCRPSDGVMIVRKHLEQVFEKSEFDVIGFHSLGPSPFHADLYIKEGDDNDASFFYSDFALVREHKGYEEIIINYKPSSYDSVFEAQFDVYLQLEDEIGVFYSHVHQRVLKMHEWIAIETEMRELLRRLKKGGIKSKLFQVFRASKLIEDLFIKLTDFENSSIFSEHYERRQFENLENTKKSIWFGSYIENERKDTPDYPVEQISKLLIKLDTNRARAIEGYVALISAIVGGAIGSIITLLLTK